MGSLGIRYQCIVIKRGLDKIFSAMAAVLRHLGFDLPASTF